MLLSYVCKLLSDEQLKKLIDVQPYRVIASKAKKRKVVWLSASPSFHETENRDFKMNFITGAKTLYKGGDIEILSSEGKFTFQGNQAPIYFELKNCKFLTQLEESDHQCFFSEENKNFVYFTKSGVAIQARGELELQFNTDEEVYFVNLKEYCLLFNHKNEIVATVSAVWENMSRKPQFYTESDGNKHLFSVKSPNGENMTIAINTYVPKCIFDTPLDPKNPFMNHVYAETAYLGGEEGEWLAMRPDCNQFYDLYGCEVEHAEIVLRDWSGNGGAVYVGALRFLWCSFTTCWESREEPLFWNGPFYAKDGYFHIDITEYMKGVFADRSQITPGVVLRGEGSRCFAVSTGDNCLDPLLICLNLKERTICKV